jgi:hypothetical protein
LTETFESKVRVNLSSKALLPLLDLEPESELQRDIRGTINKLEIIKYIVSKQQEVITRFDEKATEILNLAKEKTGKTDPILDSKHESFKWEQYVRKREYKKREREWEGNYLKV